MAESTRSQEPGLGLGGCDDPCGAREHRAPTAPTPTRAPCLDRYEKKRAERFRQARTSVARPIPAPDDDGFCRSGSGRGLLRGRVGAPGWDAQARQGPRSAVSGLAVAAARRQSRRPRPARRAHGRWQADRAAVGSRGSPYPCPYPADHRRAPRPNQNPPPPVAVRQASRSRSRSDRRQRRPRRSRTAPSHRRPARRPRSRGPGIVAAAGASASQASATVQPRITAAQAQAQAQAE